MKKSTTDFYAYLLDDLQSCDDLIPMELLDAFTHVIAAMRNTYGESLTKPLFGTKPSTPVGVIRATVQHELATAFCAFAGAAGAAATVKKQGLLDDESLWEE